MSFSRQEKDYETANSVLSDSDILQGTKNVAHQIKRTLKFSLPHHIVHILDIDPLAPFFACELSRKLAHTSNKNHGSENYSLQSTEGYIQFDENNQPIITKASQKGLFASTVIITSTISNQEKVDNLLPFLIGCGVRAVYCASLLNIHETDFTPNFYAYSGKFARNQLIGYGTTDRSHKPEIRTMEAPFVDGLAINDQALVSPLFLDKNDTDLKSFYTTHITAYEALKEKKAKAYETAEESESDEKILEPSVEEAAEIFPKNVNIKAMIKYFENRIESAKSLAFLNTTRLLKPKAQVKIDINKLVDEQLIPFLIELGKKKQPIKFFAMKNGGTHFFAYVLRRIGRSNEKMPPFSKHLVHGSRYGKNHVGGEVEWFVQPQEDMTNSIAIHIEDILEGGLTMKRLMELLATSGANEQYIVTFADKKDCRLETCKDIQPTFTVYHFKKNQFIGGVGLDYSELGRCNFNVTFFQFNTKTPEAIAAPPSSPTPSN